MAASSIRFTAGALGRVEHATLLLRPLSTLLEAITAMRAALERSPLPSRLAAGAGDGGALGTARA